MGLSALFVMSKRDGTRWIAKHGRCSVELDIRMIMIMVLDQTDAMEPRLMPHRQGRDKRDLNQL
jgi:hypothetical protein